MGLIYKIDVLQELKEAGYNTGRIRKEKLLSESSLTRIRNGEMVNINVIEKLCQLLDMQPGNIIKYKED